MKEPAFSRPIQRWRRWLVQWLFSGALISGLDGPLLGAIFECQHAVGAPCITPSGVLDQRLHTPFTIKEPGPRKALSEPSSRFSISLGNGLVLKPVYSDKDVTLQVVAGVPPQFTGFVSSAVGTLTLQWSGDGVLQSAPAVVGPWQDIPDAKSPYRFEVNGPMAYCRIRQ